MWTKVPTRPKGCPYRDQLACEREARAVTAEALGGLLVVGVVGACLAPRGLRGLVERPAQRGRALPGQVPRSPSFVRRVHGDVHPAVADRLARAREPLAVAELSQDHDARQRADPVVRGLQRPTPRLAARVGAQVLIERRDPDLERVDHPKRDRDLLASRGRQRELLDPRPVLAGQKTRPPRQPVVIQHRLHPLLPLPALVDERVPQPDPRAQIQQMVRRDPALRQPRSHQQLP